MRDVAVSLSTTVFLPPRVNLSEPYPPTIRWYCHLRMLRHYKRPLRTRVLSQSTRPPHEASRVWAYKNLQVRWICPFVRHTDWLINPTVSAAATFRSYNKSQESSFSWHVRSQIGQRYARWCNHVVSVTIRRRCRLLKDGSIGSVLVWRL